MVPKIVASPPGTPPVHPAVVNLKWSLFRNLIENHDDILAPYELLHSFVRSLEASCHDRGSSITASSMADRQTVLIAKAHRVYSLLGVRQTQIRRMAVAEARSVVRELEEGGLGEHVAAIMARLALADSLSMFGGFQEAIDILEKASQITISKFGPDHALSLTVAEKCTQMEDRSNQGPPEHGSLEKTMEMLVTSLRVMDPNATAIRTLRAALAVGYAEQNDYDKALAMIRGGKGPLKNCHDLDAAMPMLVIYAGFVCERYDQAVEDLARGIVTLEAKPWPPNSRLTHGFHIDIRKSAGMVELFEKHKLPMPRAPYPDPARFTIDPELMTVRSMLVASLRARALSEPAELAEQTRAEAAAQTASLLESIHASFLLGAHHVPVNPAWHDAQATSPPPPPPLPRGFANSAMRAAMDAGHTPLVEILTSLGFKGMHGGMHYQCAIAAAAAASSEKHVLLAAILREHYELCAHAGGSTAMGQPALFASRRELAEWVTGEWKGASLYGQLGSREDPQGLLTVELQAEADSLSHEDSAGRAGSVAFKGNYVDGQEGADGMYVVRGQVDTAGNIFLVLGLGQKGGPSPGVGGHSEIRKLDGRVNLQRQAIGGLYGPYKISEPGPIIPLRAHGAFFLQRLYIHPSNSYIHTNGKETSPPTRQPHTTTTSKPPTESPSRLNRNHTHTNPPITGTASPPLQPQPQPHPNQRTLVPVVSVVMVSLP